MKSKIVALIILILVVSCQNKEQNGKDYRNSIKVNEATSVSQKEKDITLDRKLIKEGTITFCTDNITSTRKNIFESIQKNKGYLASDNSTNYYNRTKNTLIIRVPSKNFDSLLDQVTQGVVNFDEKNINVKDVTADFLDIQARLKTKKALESRYVQLLNKAHSVTEILKVEKEIEKLRADIESTEGRLNYLKSQVSYSTLTISFYKESPQLSNDSNKFSDGFKNGWSNLIAFFVLIVNVWPFLILFVGGVLCFKFWVKRRRK